MTALPPPRPRGGFTLVEVLVSLAIVSLLLVGLHSLLDVNLKTQETLERDALLARVGPALLDVVESDLRRVWVLNIEGNRVFEGTSNSIGGRSADEMVFLTTTDSATTHRVGAREVPSDVCETGYRLRRNPDNDDFLELWRRQDYHVDEDPLEDGAYELLHDRIVSFEVRYLERLREGERPEEEWVAEDVDELPEAIRIAVELEVLPRVADAAEGARAGQTFTYERVIPMLRDSHIAMRVHPLIPDFVRGGSGGLLGSGQGDGAGEGGEGGDNNLTSDTTDEGGGEGGGSGTSGDDGDFGGGGAPGDDPDGTLDDLLDTLLGGGGGGGGGG